MKNLEDRKTIDWEIKSIIWHRDNRRCRRCECIVYRTQKPKGFVYHANTIKEDNHAANLLLLCANCKRDIKKLYDNLWHWSDYIWEMEILTQTKQQSLRDMVGYRDSGLQYHRVTKLIAELERENNMLSLPKKDVERLEYLKSLERKQIAEHNKAKGEEK
jgi:hypothetical protein